MDIKENNLIEEKVKKLEEMIENNLSYEKICNQSKMIDKLVLKKMSINIKKEN